MSRHSDPDRRREELRRRVIGLAEGSLHKSYYPELQQRLDELETANAALQREIAERTRAERSLRESDERYRMAQKLAGTGTWEWRIDTDEFIWSEEVENMWGDIPRELIGGSEDLLDCLHPEDRERWRESVRACIADGVEHDIEYRLVFPGGVVVWVAAFGDAERDEDGRVLRMMGVVRDISKSKAIERELVKSAELKQRIVDSLPIGITVFNTRGDCILVNRAQAQIVGGTTAEILEQNFHSIESWRTSGLYDVALRALQNCSTEHLEVELTTTYGKTAIFDFRLVPISAGNEQHLLLVAEDISERKKAEQELRTSEERFRLLIENAGALVSIFDRDGICLMMNPMAAEACGRAPDQFIGTNLREFHGEDGNKYIEGIRTVIDSGSPRDFEDVVRFPTGDRHLLSNIQPMRDSSGEIFAAQVISHDITARRELEEQLAQSQKMEAVGRLAGGVAHDFNNMLGVILGNTELVMATMDRDDPRYGDLVEIEQAANRSADLTRQLLAFARRQTIIPTVLDLNTTLTGMLTMFRRLLGENIALNWHPDPDLWPVKMDPAQVAQILANFCANAKDAILDVGTLDIATGNAVLDDAWCAGRSDALPGEYVRLTVSDDGRGMDEETAARIFEPFFTTKEVGAGTGLGLATVYGIVNQNGGTVDVTSSPGMGATFEVYLPRTNEPATAPKPAKIPNASPGHGETILMVEDEPGLLRSCTATLEKMGYTVIPAETGQEALELFRRHTGTIDLLITDVIMPKMSGKELADRLAELRQGIKVIFVSGYTADVISKKGVLESGVRFLQKPFSAPTLAVAVQAALDGGDHGGEL